jgi:hypothetical protein
VIEEKRGSTMATKKGFLLVVAILLAAAFVVASAEEITRELPHCTSSF